MQLKVLPFGLPSFTSFTIRPNMDAFYLVIPIVPIFIILFFKFWMGVQGQDNNTNCNRRRDFNSRRTCPDLNYRLETTHYSRTTKKCDGHLETLIDATEDANLRYPYDSHPESSLSPSTVDVLLNNQFVSTEMSCNTETYQTPKLQKPLRTHVPAQKSSIITTATTSNNGRSNLIFNSPAPQQSGNGVFQNSSLGLTRRHVPSLLDDDIFAQKSSVAPPATDCVGLSAPYVDRGTLNVSGSSHLQKTSSTGPLSRLSPVGLVQRRPTTSAMPPVTSDRTITPDKALRHSTSTSKNNFLRQGGLPSLEEKPKLQKEAKKSAATPINIVYPPRNNTEFPRCSCRKHDEEVNYNEEDENHEDHGQENDTEGEENSEEIKIDSDEEEGEAPTLDVRGLFVREALAAVQVFLPEQDQKYIESGFDEELRFVYIITGWGKLSPGKIPKLKPAVEELFNSTTYKLKYTYEWTNDGEMEVDLIGRKTEFELRKRAAERMKQNGKRERKRLGAKCVTKT